MTASRLPDNLSDLIKAILKEHPEGLRMSQIAKLVGIPAHRIRDGLQKAKDHYIGPPPWIVHIHSRQVWVLTDNEDDLHRYIAHQVQGMDTAMFRQDNGLIIPAVKHFGPTTSWGSLHMMYGFTRNAIKTVQSEVIEQLPDDEDVEEV